MGKIYKNRVEWLFGNRHKQKLNKIINWQYLEWQFLCDVYLRQERKVNRNML